jgi:hypothetical protein
LPRAGDCVYATPNLRRLLSFFLVCRSSLSFRALIKPPFRKRKKLTVMFSVEQVSGEALPHEKIIFSGQKRSKKPLQKRRKQRSKPEKTPMFTGGIVNFLGKNEVC